MEDLNRRSFLKWLGAGTAVAVVAPSTLSSCEDPWCGSIAGEGIIPHDELHGYHFDTLKGDDVICSYADYSSLSQVAIAASIDESVMDAASELGRKAGEEVAELVG